MCETALIIYSRALLQRELVTQQPVSCSSLVIFKESVIYVIENFSKRRKETVALPKKMKGWKVKDGPNYFYLSIVCLKDS